ncbi:MAG: hypothetical protein K6C10_03055 [Prevotella sp.]|nr:hypothetical protein [Prevotella sp.]
MTLKVKDSEDYIEEGTDGKQFWEYEASKLEKRESGKLYIASSKDEENDDHIDFDMYKEYKKGAIKENGNQYIITLTSPKVKGNPSKVVFYINKSNYHPTAIEAKMTFTMKMTITNIKFGVSDNVFVFDTKKYPNAKIIRKKTL